MMQYVKKNEYNTYMVGSFAYGRTIWVYTNGLGYAYGSNTHTVREILYKTKKLLLHHQY